MEHVQHEAQPEAGSLRTADGREADLFSLRDYPIHAVCRVCQGEILARSFLRAFEHMAPAKQDPPPCARLGLGAVGTAGELALWATGTGNGPGLVANGTGGLEAGGTADVLAGRVAGDLA